MIIVENLTKVYPTRHGEAKVLSDINLTVRAGERVGILGRNGSGKSTLIRLIGGAEHPTTGSVRREMSVSWPLAFAGAFNGALTGFDNLRFVCRIYGVDPNSKSSYVQDFSELGRYFYEPVKTYSAGMMARLAFAVSMAIEFDCFLIDEVLTVGDARFHSKCETELFDKRGDRAMLLVSHQDADIRRYCSRAAVLESGVLHSFDDVETALRFYHQELGHS